LFTLQTIYKRGVGHPVLQIGFQDRLLMEVLDEVSKGLLQPLLDFGEVNVGSPLFGAGNELDDKLISQVLETRDTSWLLLGIKQSFNIYKPQVQGVSLSTWGVVRRELCFQLPGLAKASRARQN